MYIIILTPQAVPPAHVPSAELLSASVLETQARPCVYAGTLDHVPTGIVEPLVERACMMKPRNGTVLPDESRIVTENTPI